MKDNKFNSLLNRLSISLSKAVKRFPYAVIFAAMAALTMIIFTHSRDSLTQIQVQWYERIVMVLVLGIPFALSVKMLIELYEKPIKIITIGVRLLCLALLTVYLLYGLPKFDMFYIVRYFCFSLFLWGMLLSIPFLKKRAMSEVFTFKVGWRLLIAVFYCGILYGGFSGILFALKELLNVPIVSEHYQDLLFVIAGVILPSFFFVGIPLRDEKLPDNLTKFFRILLVYVIMPILTVYTAVLYIYFFRMISEQSLPKNIIGNLVLWYSIIGIIVLYMARPEKLKNKWVNVFDKLFPLLLFVPLGMMFTAIFIRIRQYGITELRYYVVIGGVWSLAMIMYLIIRKTEKRNNVIIPLTASLLALLTIVGPWSSFSVSRYSQNNILENIFIQNDMIADGKLVASSSISKSDKEQISSILYYFNNKQELSDAVYIDEDTTISEIEKTLDIEIRNWYPILENRERNNYFFRLREEDITIELGDYDYMHFIRGGISEIKTEIGDIVIESYDQRNNEDSQTIVVRLNDIIIYENDLLYFAKLITEKYPDREELAIDELSFIEESDELIIKIVFFHIEYNGESSSPESAYADFVIMIDIK